MRLFWVTTEDYDEDWFIVANDFEEAERFHEGAEGYDTGDASAEEVLTIPDHCDAEVGWPPEALLRSVGARFLAPEPARVVQIDNRTYCEGLLEGIIWGIDDDVFEKLGDTRLNDTTKTKPE